MKNTFLTIFVVISTITCFGQSFFFNDLNSSTWTSSSDVSDLSLKSYKEIPLSKLIHSKDSINKDATIWTFKDSVLTIVKYSFKQKTESVLGKYKYSVSDKSTLQIMLQDGTSLNYKVGVVSTGFNVVLYKTKAKRQKTKK